MGGRKGRLINMPSTWGDGQLLVSRLGWGKGNAPTKKAETGSRPRKPVSCGDVSGPGGYGERGVSGK